MSLEKHKRNRADNDTIASWQEDKGEKEEWKMQKEA